GRDRRGERAGGRGAADGTGGALAAIVADERRPAVVHGLRHAALRAAEVVAALAAEEKGRVAPPRLQKDGLLAGREDLPEPLDERPGEERHALLVRARALALEVHDGDARQRLRVHPGGEHELRHPAAPGGLL